MWVLAALAASVAVSLIGIAALLWRIAIVQRVLDGSPVSLGEARASDDFYTVSAILILVCLPVVAVPFIWWLRRATINLSSFGWESVRWGSKWAVGSWFIPIANCVLPYRITHQAWEMSISTPQSSPQPRLGRLPLPVMAWQVAWVGGNLLATGLGGVISDTSTAERVRTGAWVLFGLDWLTIVAACLAANVVIRITSRQNAAAQTPVKPPLHVATEPD